MFDQKLDVEGAIACPLNDFLKHFRKGKEY
jgi:hypothetical protein